MQSKYNCNDLIKYHFQNKHEVLKYFKKNSGLSKVIGSFYYESYQAYKDTANYCDFPLILNICSFIIILLETYPLKINNDDIEKTLLKILDESVYQLINSFENQIKALNYALKKLTEHFQNTIKKGVTIILLELPIGNSIPLQLLRLYLDEVNIKYSSIFISLSRNDKARLGLKRIDLIEKKLKEFKFKDSDLILYIDEWFTGANFNNICEFVLKKLPHNILFYPIAFLSDTAKENPNYSKFVENHNKITNKFKIPEDISRFKIPPINTVFKIEPNDLFFWSEYDRLAGYRKMQIAGSLISSIKWAIEKLLNEDELLELTKKEIIFENLESKDVDNKTWEDMKILKEFFNSSYKDFLMVLPDLEIIEDNYNLGNSDNIDKSIEDISTQILEKLKDRYAKYAVSFALVFLKKFGGINPVDRYYFKAHVPVTKKLEGVAALLNTKFVEIFLSKFKK